MLIYRCKSLDWLNQVNSKQWASCFDQDFHFLIELKYIIRTYSSRDRLYVCFRWLDRDHPTHPKHAESLSQATPKINGAIIRNHICLLRVIS